MVSVLCINFYKDERQFLTFAKSNRMDFGHVPEGELDKINFTLQKEPDWNKGILINQIDQSPRIYIGCPRWANKSWLGKLYPKTLPDARTLDEYLRQFNTIELNATHYKIYDTTAIKKWVDKAKGKNFLFCPKVYQGISHEGLLTDKHNLTAAFFESVMAFGENLGPVFLQLSEKFGPQRKEELFLYLNTLPKHLSIFLEVRHADWFREPHLTNLLEQLKKMNIGLMITDTAGRRDCCHMHLTKTKAFVRFVANSLHATDYTRLDAWVERIQYWIDNGLTEIYFMLHMHEEAYSPELAIYMIEALNKIDGIQIKKPVFPQPSLFD